MRRTMREIYVEIDDEKTVACARTDTLSQPAALSWAGRLSGGPRARAAPRGPPGARAGAGRATCRDFARWPKAWACRKAWVAKKDAG